MTNKVTLKGPTTGYLSSAQHLFNNNALTVALNNTISRDGSLPNEMLADFDLNGNRILNAPAPLYPTDVIRLEDIQGFVLNGVDTSYRPKLRTFLEASGIPEANWATTNMHTYVHACAAACNALRVVGDISGCGSVCLDGTTIIFIPGAGFSHEINPLDSRMNSVSGQLGTTFVRHDTAYNNSPAFALSSNCTLKCFGLYADRIAEGASLDPTSYPTITGSLKTYAPFVCTDHTRDYNGNKITAGTNVSYFTVECTVLGAHTSFYFGDGDLTEESTWATDFFSGKGKSTGGMRAILKGMATNRDLVLNRVVINSDVNNGVLVDFGPQHWIEVQNTRSNAQLLRDPTQTEAPDNPLSAFRQKNCVSITGGHRWIGVTLKGKTRIANTAVYLKAGTAPAPWIAAEAAVDAALVAASQPTQGYPATHPDNGKYVSSPIEMNVEGVPTGLWIAADAWLYRSSTAKLSGLFKDFTVATTQPVINVLTDATKAGTLDKQGNWKSITRFTGGIDIELGVKIADGSLFKNTSTDSQRRWKFSGWAANWGHGGDTSAAGIHGLWAFDNNSTLCYINSGLALYKGAFGSVRAFNTPTLDNLYCNDLMEWFGYNTSVPPIDTTVCSIMAGFSPGGVCYPTWNATTDDGGDDGGGGDGGNLTVSVTPTTRSATRSGAGAITSGTFVTSASGGNSPYTYLWTRTAGSTAITATASTNKTTAFTATLGVGDDDTATFTVNVTDSTGLTGSASVTVELSETGDVSPPEDLAVSIVPTTRSATRSGAGTLTTGTFVATASGGMPPYTYSWNRTAGDTAVTPTSPTTASTAATATLAPGDALSATFTLTVTDAILNTATGDVHATLVETS